MPTDYFLLVSKDTKDKNDAHDILRQVIGIMTVSWLLMKI